MHIVVIDGQGGKIGRLLIEGIRKELSTSVEITAIGTNSIATAVMMKAGADHAATGENATLVAARRADVITGPFGIVLADALTGEVTPSMAAAVSQSDAVRVLIPFHRCNTFVVGAERKPIADLIAEAITLIQHVAQENK
ncbi:MAG: DUF3842 family protein [Clostridia bacterium]|nr:DUF3842 family protein [Clostridia bacterium]